MYSPIKFSIGIVIFIGIITSPIWYNFDNIGKENIIKKPKIATDAVECIESAAYMRKNHMVLLHEWRDSVVRENNRIYVNKKGKTFNKSLTKTCLKCHSNKKEFCDTCHKTAAVKLYCFDCHTTPGPITGDSPHGNK